MKRQNRSLRFAMLIASLALSSVFTYAQSVQKIGGTKAGRPTEDTGTARVDGQPMVKDYQKLIDWLNANPGRVVGGGPTGGTGGTSKYVYHLLEVHRDRLSDMDEIEVTCCHIIVAPPSQPNNIIYAPRDFEGTVYIPKEFQTDSGFRRRLEPKIDPETGGVAKGMPNPYLETLRNIQIALFDLTTGRMEAQTTTESNGNLTFAGISDGTKAIFIKDASGNLYFLGNVEICGRVVDKDGKGCTEGGHGPRGRPIQFTLAPEVASMYRRHRPLTRT